MFEDTESKSQKPEDAGLLEHFTFLSDIIPHEREQQQQQRNLYAYEKIQTGEPWTGTDGTIYRFNRAKLEAAIKRRKIEEGALPKPQSEITRIYRDIEPEEPKEAQ